VVVVAGLVVSAAAKVPVVTNAELVREYEFYFGAVKK
jgi:hypothetical protein